MKDLPFDANPCIDSGGQTGFVRRRLAQPNESVNRNESSLSLSCEKGKRFVANLEMTSGEGEAGMVGHGSGDHLLNGWSIRIAGGGMLLLGGREGCRET